MEAVIESELDMNKPFSFSNVMKETAGETYKYWNKLLKSKTLESFENFEQIVSPSEPLPGFEEKLRLILIDNLELDKEAVKVLLSQNDYSIKKVLKFKWFFQSLSSEFYLREIFPKVSVSVRFKVINKLSKYLKSEEEAEKLFDFIASHYGYEVAEVLIPQCSSEFIINYCKKSRPLVEYEIWKRERIILKICKRYPEIGVRILDLSFNHKLETDHFKLCGGDSIIKYLAANHTDLFIPFFKKYIHELKHYGRIFSKPLSWKLVKILKDYVFESILTDSENLHRIYVFSKFNTNDKIRFLTSLVCLRKSNETWDGWNDPRLKLVDFIKRISPNDRYPIITSVFKQVYNLNFRDQTKCWFPDLLELLPAKDRLYFAETLEKYYKSSEAEFKESFAWQNFDREKPETAIYLYGFCVAFDKFKNIITKTPEKYRRKNIIEYMVKCCQINHDPEGLEKVVDFVATRQRNEHPPILIDFVDNVCSSFPRLSQSVCRKLENLLLFLFAKGSSDSYTFGRLIERDIYLCLESGQETDDLIKKLFEFAILKPGNAAPFLSNCQNKHSKTLLLAVGEEISRWIQSHPNESQSEILHSAWINTCEKYVTNNKSSKISVGDIPGYENAVKELLKAKFNQFSIDWVYDTLETYDTDFLKFDFINKHICRLLRRKPTLILQQLESVLEYLGWWFYPVFVKHSSFLNVTDNIKQLTLKRMQKANSNGERRNALHMYSLVCTIEEFTEAVQEFIPLEDNVKEDSDSNFTETQLYVPKIIKNIKPSWKNLNLILKFYRGDFLKEVTSSFYICCYNSRADFIVPFLNKFILTVPQRVSYKKDIIRLICALSDRDEKISFILKTWENEKHYSIRRILFQVLKKIFLEEPNRELFNSLVKCILDSEEAMFNDEKPDFKKFPKEFWNEYAVALWKFSKSFSIREDFQNNIIWNFNLDNINILSEEFCEEVLRDYLFPPKPLVQVERFACYYCAAGPGTIDTRLNMIFNLMREFKINAPRAASFLEVLFNESHRNPIMFVEVFATLLRNWPESFSLYEEKLFCFYYHLYYGILQTTKERNVVSVEFGKQLKDLFSKMQSLDSLSVIITDTLKQFFIVIVRNELPFHPLLVVKELMKEPQEKIFAIIALGALPPEIGDSYLKNDTSENASGDKATLNDICNSLESMNDDVLWIYFRRTFKENKPLMVA